MDIHLLVPSAFHEKLKCSLCKNYLSYFPISVCSNNENVCGRCTIPEGDISYQDEAFETICQFLKYPCRYQSEGCPEHLAPKDVPQHEENCSYRVVPCFINKPISCKWKGSLPTLLPHCQTEHSDMILKDGEFQMDLERSEITENLLECDEQLLVITRKFKPKNKMLHCAVYHHPYQEEVKSYACQLSVTSDNKKLSINFNTSSSKEMILQSLCLKSISYGNDTVRLGKIKVRKEESGDQRLQIVAEANLQLLSLLKCCTCSDFAVPPIYHCVESMNILCSGCNRSHSHSCRSCAKSKNQQLLNLQFEKIVDLVSYPCKYRQNGCSQFYKYKPMGFHDVVCEYRDDKICPLFEFKLCKWKGLNKDICDHVVNNHGDLILESSEVALVLSLEMKTPQCNIIRFSNRLFRLVFCVDEDKRYMWSVEMIGCYEKGFKFAIDIIDANSESRLLMCQHCHPLVNKDFLFKMSFIPYCYFLEDQICDSVKIENNQVTFRVHIFK